MDLTPNPQVQFHSSKQHGPTLTSISEDLIGFQGSPNFLYSVLVKRAAKKLWLLQLSSGFSLKLVTPIILYMFRKEARVTATRKNKEFHCLLKNLRAGLLLVKLETDG